MAKLVERKSNMRIVKNRNEMLELLVAKYSSYDRDDFIIEKTQEGGGSF